MSDLEHNVDQINDRLDTIERIVIKGTLMGRKMKSTVPRKGSKIGRLTREGEIGIVVEVNRHGVWYATLQLDDGEQVEQHIDYLEFV